jgi:iron-sulfur cluster assembly accessory protein
LTRRGRISVSGIAGVSGGVHFDERGVENVNRKWMRFCKRRSVEPSSVSSQDANTPAGLPRRLLLMDADPYSRVMAATEIKYKIGNERLVKVTGSAAAKLSQLLKRQGRPQGALRVAVIGGGCSGLQYKMDLVDGPANRDILVESNSVRVVVDPKSALFVSGSLLDYSDDLQKGGFKVTNPNAVAHCSCGESFSA